MIESGNPEDLHQLRTDVPYRESPADSVHPMFEADDLAQGGTDNKLNIAQIENQMNTGLECNRVEKALYRVPRKQVLKRPDHCDVAKVFPGEPH